MINTFQRTLTEIAVPVGTAALDEITVQTKARTGAKTFIRNKPDKYGIRFYGVVATWPGAYIHSLSNNWAGNTSNFNPAQSYCAIFSTLKRLYNKYLEGSALIDKASA